ncbi:hypothetical protein EMIT0158MI4_150091 [Burkholderia ambifaria]
MARPARCSGRPRSASRWIAAEMARRSGAAAGSGRPRRCSTRASSNVSSGMLACVSKCWRMREPSARRVQCDRSRAPCRMHRRPDGSAAHFERVSRDDYPQHDMMMPDDRFDTLRGDFHPVRHLRPLESGVCAATPLNASPSPSEPALARGVLPVQRLYAWRKLRGSL